MKFKSTCVLLALLATTSFATACTAAEQTTAKVMEAPVAATVQEFKAGFKPSLYYTNVDKRFGDLSYATQSDAQKLDLYLPAHAKKPYPVILAIHGGSWAEGDKATGEVNPEMVALNYGFAVASINYRLSDEAAFPAALQDCKAAVRFLKANAKKYKLDDKIIAWGDSAGANLAALLGTTAKVSSLEDKTQGNAKKNSEVSAVVAFFPPVNLATFEEEFKANKNVPSPSITANTSLMEKYLGAQGAELMEKSKVINPINYINNDTVPFFIMNGDKDDVVPVQQSKDLADALVKVIGAHNVEYMVIRGAGHGGPAFSQVANLTPVFNFLHKQLGTPDSYVKNKK
jgi:acetyl esterase/lipase